MAASPFAFQGLIHDPRRRQQRRGPFDRQGRLSKV